MWWGSWWLHSRGGGNTAGGCWRWTPAAVVVVVARVFGVVEWLEGAPLGLRNRDCPDTEGERSRGGGGGERRGGRGGERERGEEGGRERMCQRVC